jgi:hypothetical protein
VANVIPTTQEKKESEKVIAEAFPNLAKALIGERIVGFTAEQFDTLKNFEQKQIETLDAILKATSKVQASITPSVEVNDKPKATSRNAESIDAATNWIKGGMVGGHTKWVLDKEEFLSTYGYDNSTDGMIGAGLVKKSTEAVTSGTQPIQYNRKSILLPGGRMAVPIRQFCNFERINGGADRAAWYTMDGFDFGSITEGTAPSEAAPTITQETAVPDTRGAFIKVKYSQIEDNPFPLVEALNQRALVASIENETTEVISTQFDAATMASGHWINGNTGATLSSDDVASMTLTITGVATAKKQLINAGYGGFPMVFCVHPKNYMELVISSGIDKFTQQGVPEITRTGLLESLLGVQIVQTNKVKAQDNTTNDTYRNVMFVPGETFGLAASRDLTVKAEEHSELQQLYWTATHRIKGKVFDSGGVDSAVRVSCAQ